MTICCPTITPLSAVFKREKTVTICSVITVLRVSASEFLPYFIRLFGHPHAQKLSALGS